MIWYDSFLSASEASGVLLEPWGFLISSGYGDPIYTIRVCEAPGFPLGSSKLPVSSAAFQRYSVQIMHAKNSHRSKYL